MNDKIKTIGEISWIVLIIIGVLWVVGSWIYDTFNPKYYPPQPPIPTFDGDECTTSDCSGHKAGFEWASKNGIDNIDKCIGNSESFEEGCQSFVEGNH